MAVHDKRSRLASRLSALSRTSSADRPEPIAIVGVAGQFPQCASVGELWRAMDRERSLISEMPADRSDWLSHAELGVVWGGFLPDIRGFDAKFFEVLPRQADLMDPRRRLLLKTVYHALEDAGYAPDSLRESSTAVFVAAEEGEYLPLLRAAGISSSELPPGSPALLPSHISHFFDFRGASECVNTMCSSGAVAIHRAVATLRSGEADRVVVAAVNLVLSPEPHLALARTGQMSPDPVVSPFGRGARGFLRSEGVAAVVLETRRRALSMGSAIYATIKNSHINYNGSGGTSIAAPDIAAHVQLIRRCYEGAGMDIRALDYIEAQGMANPVADLAEWEAFNRAIDGVARAQGVVLRPGHCAVSTLKPTLGHMHSASALAAMLRIIRSFQTDTIHGIGEFSEPHPSLELADRSCRLATGREPWQRRDWPRLAALHSYGSSGNNAHILLEEHVDVASNPNVEVGSVVLPFSARSMEQCRTQIENVLDACENGPCGTLASVARTLQVGRDAMSTRVAFVADDLVSFIRAGRRFLAQECSSPGVFPCDTSAPSNPSQADDVHRRATSWARGERVSWQRWAHGPLVTKSHLPGYAFAELAHWIPDSGQANVTRHGEGCEEFAMLPGGLPTGDAGAESIVRALVGSALNAAPSTVELRRRFSEMGFDSMMVGNLVGRLRHEHGISIDPAVMFELDCPWSLVEYLAEGGGRADASNGRDSEAIRTASGGTRRDERGPLAVCDSKDAIAIVGIAGRFPRAQDLSEFWHNLQSSADCVENLPGDRWGPIEDFFEADVKKAIASGKSYGGWGGFLEGAEDFDPSFFNTTPLEAEHMNPKERLFLQCVWHVLEDAGHTPESLRDQRVGVFVGATRSGPDPYWVSSFPIANRVSYHFDFRGPSMPIDTACSSSLVALHLACQSIRAGECDSAIAGGVHVFLTSEHFAALSRTSMLAPDGRCRSFGSAANGMVPGEGVGAVMVKPLASALRDGDQIHGIVRGSAINHGGRANGFTMPNPRAHCEVIREALRRAEVEPGQVSYIEAHGTGTALGDPVEIRGLTEAFGKGGPRTQSCRLGSVKSNIGHLEAAAGVSGLAKILLQMRHRCLVPSLHAESTNPNIDFGATPFELQRVLETWSPLAVHGIELPRIACLSSFGAGGSNAHVVIQEPPVDTDSAVPLDGPAMIVLSARGEARLQANAANLLEWLDSSENCRLHDVAYTLQVGRRAMEERLGFVVESISELRSKLTAWVQESDRDEATHRARIDDASRPGKRSDEVMHGAVRDVVAERDFDGIVRLWVEGAAIDWQSLYGDEARRPRKLSLPGYSFERRRFPVPSPRTPSTDGVSSTKHLHPLVQVNTSNFERQSFSSRFTGNESFLRDHVILGERVLPGVAYLEMAVQSVLAAMDQRPAFPDEVLRLSRVTWMRPFSVADEPRDLEIELDPGDGSQIEFEVRSGTSEPIVHARGRVEWTEPTDASPLDLARVRAGCDDQQIEAETCYDAFAAFGIAYGPSHRGLKRVWVGHNQVFAEVASTSQCDPELKDSLLHPSLLDAALQATLALLVPASELVGIESGAQLRPSLPFSVDEVEVVRACPAEMWVWIREEVGRGDAGSIRKLDLDICDEGGCVCVRLRGFSLRELSRTNAGNESDENIPPAGMISMTPVWNSLDEAERRALHQTTQQTGCVTIVGGTQLQRAALRTVLPESKELQGTSAWTQARWNAAIESDLGSRRFVWIAPEPVRVDRPADAFIERQDDGTIALFRLIKALLHHQLGGKRVEFTVVTVRAQEVLAGEWIDPTHASVHGLIGSLAKEYPHWTIRLFDLGDALDWPAAEMFEFGGDPHGNALACRARTWFKQELVSVREMAPSDHAWREAGVYVVIGGAGGIGRVLSRHLVDDHRAQLVWVGRRELNDEIGENLTKLTRTDESAPIYLRADATDRAAMEVVRDEVLKRFGRIDGVVHSAIVLDDQSLARMTEGAFRRALSAKVDVSVRMAQAFPAVPLIFFSSMQSFVKTAGQSNYSAGCTFKDAFAQAMSSFGTKVKIINWGYWGSVGIVATAAVQERMAAVGVGSIEPNEGMAALDQILQAPVDQFVVMKTSKPVVPAGMNPHEWISCLPARSQGTVDDVLDALPPESERIESLAPDEADEQRRMVDLMVALLRAELESMGLLVKETIDLAEVRARVQWVDQHHSWLVESLCILEERGYLEARDGGFTVVGEDWLSREAAWAQFEARMKVWRDRPHISAQVSLLEVMLRALPEILLGRVPATDVMFPGSSVALVEGVHRGNAVSDAFNRVLADVVEAYVRQRCVDGSAAPVRILEIGAGTGGTTCVVLNRLESLRESVEEYHYTDLSEAFLQHARKEFVPDYPFVRTSIFDVEQPLAVAGIDPGHYDIVIAANVLHATRNIRQTVRNAKAALTRNGLLLLNEMSGNNLFSHLTFGLLEGWWLYEDSALRVRGCPALDANSWAQVLCGEGFRRVEFPTARFHDRGLQVIVAQSDGVIRQRRMARVRDRRSTHEKRDVRRTERARGHASDGLAGSAQTGTLSARTISHLKKVVAETLKMNPGEIDPAQPFERYGIDSIIVVQLTNALDEIFGDISSTLLFEHQSIAAVADHLVATRESQLRELLGTPRTSSADLAEGEAVRAPVTRRMRRMTRAHAPRRREGTVSSRDVAIIGLAGRYPGAEDIDQFWTNLRDGRNCIVEIPRDRWDWRRYFDESRGRWGTSYTKYGGFLEGVDRFDPAFFQISPREAEGIDPQERLFLEVAYHCIEDAGYTPSGLTSAGKVGVFVGVMNSNYPTGTRYWSIANRVSYLLDFQGPSLAIDTACSSSLSSLHVALDSLRSGTCDYAIAGGVNLVLSPFHHLRLALMNMVAADDRTKAFGDEADGFVDGEGVGAVVLKPLDRALADGDHIHGVIKGSAVNHGGKTNGYTVPSPVGQGRLVEGALRDAGVDARTLSYVEAHGTGTALGDPVEIAGLQRAFEGSTSGSGYCAIGSVKSNIGHAESAAGIAGLTKVLLQMRHQQLAPSLHCEVLNPQIDFERTPFRVNRSLVPWRRPIVDGCEVPRRAGISSFGAGGANAHVVVEEFASVDGEWADGAAGGVPEMVVLSARNRERLEVYARNLLAFVRSRAAADVPSDRFLMDLAHTLQIGRVAMEARLGVVVRSTGKLEQALEQFIGGVEENPCWVYGQARADDAWLAGLSNDGELLAPLDAWIAKGEHYKVLQMWVRGLMFDWSALDHGRPDDCQPRRISAPTYPFARESYRVDEAELRIDTQHEVSAVLHPLVHVNTSNFSEQLYESTFSGQECFLRDHVVAGQKVLPGVAYLEMAVQAVRFAAQLAPDSGVSTVALSRIHWLQPFEVGDTPRRIMIRLEPQDDGEIVFEAHSEGVEPIIHSQGRALITSHVEDHAIDLRAVRDDCHIATVEGDACYAAYAAIGIDYGASHRALRAIHVGRGQVLAEIALGEEAEDDDFVLHPGLIDSALQATMGLFAGSGSKGVVDAGLAEIRPLLPFSLDSLEILRTCPSHVWAWIRRVRPSVESGFEKLDLDLCDTCGNVCVRMKGFSVRAMAQTSSDKRPASGPEMVTMIPVWRALDPSELRARHDESGALRPEVVVGATASQRACFAEIVPQLRFADVDEDGRLVFGDRALPSVDDARHYVWVAPDPDFLPELERLIERQAAGVMQLLRLVKTLDAMGLASKRIALTVITTAAVEVGEEDASDPAQASIHGLVGSLAKEFPHWTIRLFDLEETSGWPVGDMFDLKGDPRGNLLVHRRGTWFERSLVRITDIAEDTANRRSPGVVVVLGGAGGLGKVFSQHLLTSTGPRIVWVGRRPSDEAIEASIAELAAGGGPPPMYVQADATDLVAMQSVRAWVEEHVGRVDCVVHSTIVLNDQSLAKMPTEGFGIALKAKVDVSVRMAQVFEDAQFVFFSSLQSFVMAPGQSNYSAGCTFEDAFALWLARRGMDVKVVNWGYWGSVGVVATDAVRERMATLGMASIEPAEGMEALDAMLRSPLSRAVVLRGNGAAVMALTGQSREVVRLPARGPAFLEQVDWAKPHESLAPVSRDELEGQTRLLEISTDLLFGELAALGVFGSGEFTLAECKRSVGWEDAHDRWMVESLNILVDAGRLRLRPGGYELACEVRVSRADAWQAFAERKPGWLKQPLLAAQVVLLEEMMQALPRVLLGRCPATDVMFPESSLRLVEGIYRGNGLTDGFNAVLAEVVVSYVRHRLELDSSARIRILEIGAGTGGTAAVVLEALRPLQAAIEEYLYTDLSPAFLRHALDEYAPGNPFLKTALFDVEKPASIAGIEEGSFDLVIAANVLHATRSMRRTVRNAKGALARNGWLLLNEMSRNNLFSHLTFGLLEGWWLYEDEAMRLRGCPALSPDAWYGLLREEGFGPVEFPAAAHHDRGLQIIVAQSDGVPSAIEAVEVALAPSLQPSRASRAQAAPPRAVDTEEPAQARWPREGNSAGPAPGSAAGEALLDRTIEYLVGLMARTLKMTAASIDPSEAFEHYGIDSIVVVQLTNALDDDLGEISSTLLFEHQSVRAVAEVLVENRRSRLIEMLGLDDARDADVRDGIRAQIPAVRDEVRPPLATPTRIRRNVSHRRSESAVSSPIGRVKLSIPRVDSTPSRDIAIVGLAGRYPAAAELTEFWSNLKSGRNCISEIPSERWDWRQYFTPERGTWGTMYTKYGGFIEGIDRFDAAFFRLSPREAEGMDPQERLFVETAYQSIEDAGYDPASLGENRRVGVFVGVMNSHYPTGTRFWSVANRVSYLLDLRGPSVAVDTACSSSLTALHSAVESLRSGGCDCAIVGGVNLIVDPAHYFGLSKMSMVSAGPKNRAFGDGADGFVDGEGVGALLLKQLSWAIKDGDHIYAVVKGSAVNHGGRTNGYTVPNPAAQAEVVTAALRDAEVEARTVSYVEAHGTGTALGDPVEIAGLTRAFAENTSDRGFCAIGSVKSNIGHTESAAGIAGLTKVLLQFQHRQLAPTLHCEQLNPSIDFDRTPFRVNRERVAWDAPHIEGVTYPRRAGLSSFGAGGANAHVVLEEYVAEFGAEHGQSDTATSVPEIFVLSAKNHERLKAYALRLATFVESQVEAAEQPTAVFMMDLAFTLQVGRAAMAERLGIVARTPLELAESLHDFSAGRSERHPWFHGKLDAKKSDIERLFAEGEVTAPLETWMSRGQYEKVIRLWVQGLPVDWERLARKERGVRAPRRMSAPTYPFAGGTHWISQTALRGVGALQGASQGSSETVYARPNWHRSVSAVDDAPAASSRLGDDDLLVCVGLGVRPRLKRCVVPGANVSEIVLEFDTAGSMASAMERSLEQLRGGLVAHLARRAGRPVRIVVVHDLSPLGSLLAAGIASFLRCVTLERPDMGVKVLGSRAEICDDADALDLVVANELRTEWSSDVHVRYPGNPRERWVMMLEPFEPTRVALHPAPVRASGLIWVTGGSGGIAVQVARHLTAELGVRVFLLGRSPIDVVQTKPGFALAPGVEYHQVDVTQVNELEALLDSGKRRGLSLHGVIHAAAVLEDAAFTENSAAQIRRVLQPKALGIEMLDHVTRDEELSFFVAFSSMAAVLGNFGQSVYSAANAFLDGFVELRAERVARGERSGRSISIAWPYWAEGGMEAHPRLLETFADQAGVVPLASEHGCAALSRILVSDEGPRVLVNQVERAFIRNLWIDSLTGDPSKYRELHSTLERGDEPSSGACRESLDLEFEVPNILAKITKLPQQDIGEDLRFADVGMDSIMMMALVQQLQSRFDARVYVNELQGLETVGQLISYLRCELGGSTVEAAASSEPAHAPRTGRTVAPTPVDTDRVLFVLGTPRSGSTLLRVMLQNNPCFFAPPELGLLGYETMQDRRAQLDRAQQAFVEEGLVVALQQLAGGTMEDAQATIAQYERDAVPVACMFTNLRSHLAPERFLVDKSPGYGESVETLFQAERELAQPRYIFIYRHPLSVMASIVDNRFHKLLGIDGDPWKIAEQIWWRWNHNIRTFLDSVPSARQIHVPYESLVADPEMWMQYLCDRLGVAYDERMVRPYDGLADSMVHGRTESSLMIGDPNFLRHTAIDPKLAMAWKKHRGRWPALESSTRELAGSLGYDPNKHDFAACPRPVPSPHSMLPAQLDFVRRRSEEPTWLICSRIRWQSRDRASLAAAQLAQNFERLVERNPALRTGFDPSADFEPIVRSVAQSRDSFRWVDASGQSEADREAAGVQLIEEMRARIDLSSGAVCRVSLQSVSSTECVALLVVHHLAADGVSLGLMARELFEPRRQSSPATDAALDRTRYVQYAAIHGLPSFARRLEQEWRTLEQPSRPRSEQVRNEYADERELRREVAASDLEGAGLATIEWENLALALYRALHRERGVEGESLTIAHRLHRRRLFGGHATVSDVGYYAGDVPITLTSAELASSEAALRRLRNVRTLGELGGAEYQLLALDGRVPSVRELAAVRLNYQPFSSVVPTGVLEWETWLYSPANVEREYELDCIVREGVGGVSFIVRYCASLHEQSAIHDLVGLWLHELGCRAEQPVAGQSRESEA